MTLGNTIILRFRDLVTEQGGTIKEHKHIIQKYGEVWWGWWMRPQERPPRTLFQELSNRAESSGPIEAYLLDTGSNKLYAVRISKVATAPSGSLIVTPDPDKSPEYYHRGRYPAWFLLKSLEEARFEDLRLTYESFPTKPEMHDTFAQFRGQKVKSLEELRHHDVTLWVVKHSPLSKP